MKKIFYILTSVALLSSFTLKAEDPSLWEPKVGEKAATFDEWTTETNADGSTYEKPYGWYRSIYGTSSFDHEPATPRTGATGKGIKITITGSSSWYTWHNQLRSNTLKAENPDYHPLVLEKGFPIYYTFWAKSDEEGTIVHVGPEELYNPSNNNADSEAWKRMPSMTLTTKWTKYGVVIPAREVFMNCVQFNVHLRGDGVRYLDDIELREGTELPDDVGSVEGGSSIFEFASDENPLVIFSTEAGISFTSTGGEITIYDTAGKFVTTEVVNEGLSRIPLATKGLHLVKYVKDGKVTTEKVIVR